MSDFEFKKDDCPLVDIEYQRGYLQGKADRDKELVEHNVFCSNRPIEDLVLDAITDERERIVEELKQVIENGVIKIEKGSGELFKIVRGGENENI